VPRLIQRIGGNEIQLTLLTGWAGSFPFCAPIPCSIAATGDDAPSRRPVFPRPIHPGKRSGSQLRLFGALSNPPLYRPYYRAFNLAHYRR